MSPSTACHDHSDLRIAILIPCYNEEPDIANVVRQFRAECPTAEIYVFDNNSSDRTAEKAREAGASVIQERRQGKGYVVQSMFRLVEADVYVMVDGDDTYPAQAVHRLIDPVARDDADMVVGSRLHDQSRSQFRALNRLGNEIFAAMVNAAFKVKLSDVLSGYRAFSREFVKGLPLFGGGFEIETELTIKALERGFRIVEVPVDLRARQIGSQSKIRVVRDGILILNTILALVRDYKPLTFFAALGAPLILAGLALGLMVFFGSFETGSVRRVPSAVLSMGLILLGGLSVMVGLILHTIARRFQELDHRWRVLSGMTGFRREASRALHEGARAGGPGEANAKDPCP